jgi:hypothetical protein
VINVEPLAAAPKSHALLFRSTSSILNCNLFCEIGLLATQVANTPDLLKIGMLLLLTIHCSLSLGMLH